MNAKSRTPRKPPQPTPGNPIAKAKGRAAVRYPRPTEGGWQVAPDTPVVPDPFWPFYDGSANTAAALDDPLWGLNAVQFVGVHLASLAGDWNKVRTRSNTCFWLSSEGAMHLAMNRVFAVAALHLTTEECDRLQNGYAVARAGSEAYRASVDDIRLAGGDSAPNGADLNDQWVQVDSAGKTPKLAKALLSVIEANPFRGDSLNDLIGEGGILSRLEAKLNHGLPKTPAPDRNDDDLRVDWNPEDRDYVPGAEAVAYVVRTGRSTFSLQRLAGLPVHYMVNPDRHVKGPGSVQRMVHRADLETWCKDRPAPLSQGGGPAQKKQPNDPEGESAYIRGLASGRPEGYRRGYESRKAGESYRNVPPNADNPADALEHGWYDGWKKGYAEGWEESQNGRPQRH